MENNINNTASNRVTPVNNQNNSEIDFYYLLNVFLLNWKWFVLSAIVCVCATRVYLSTKPFIYQRQAVMLVKEDQSTGKTKGMDALMQLNGVSMGSSVKNEVYILQSHLLLGEVVKSLKMNVMYNYKSGLLNVSLYNEKPFEVNFVDGKDFVALMKIDILSSTECEIYGIQNAKGSFDFRKKVRFGEMVTSPAGKFMLIPNTKYLKDFISKTISVTRLSQEVATNMLSGKVSASEVDKMSTLVCITCTDTNIHRADDILNALLEAYKASIIYDKNQVAQSTAKFINERVKLISAELGDVEEQLADFKQNNGIVDFSQSAQSVLQQSAQARNRTMQIQAQQSVAQYMLDFLMSKSEGKSLIPALGGLSDASIHGQIQNYNTLMLQRNKLASNSGEDSPTIRELDINLDQMKQAIIASMQAYRAQLAVQYNEAEQEERLLRGNMASVPQKEKTAIDIARQQSIKETLYTYLLNKREETTLQLAITEANVRIVERPYGSTAPISPRKFVITLCGLLFGLALPFCFFYIKDSLDVSIRDRKDIEDNTTIPVLGEIPHRKEGIADNEILVTNKNNSGISEAFRLVRFSLDFIHKDARVIMFTSTTPHEGKTFVSRNLAATIALAGKKVLLIDADIRKRTQSRLVGKQNREGLTSFLSGATDNIDTIISKQDQSFDLMPAGIAPPNPAELLMSNRLEQLMEELKKIYDVIIVDNVPAMQVADAGIVNRVADMTIYVIREGGIDRRYLNDLERMYRDNVFKNLCILLNDVHIERKRYGYGYGYGYAKGKHYGYGYGNAPEKKSRFSFRA